MRNQPQNRNQLPQRLRFDTTSLGRLSKRPRFDTASLGRLSKRLRFDTVSLGLWPKYYSITQFLSLHLFFFFFSTIFIGVYPSVTYAQIKGDYNWIGGFQRNNGMLYKDSVHGTKTVLTCYYDRGTKRYGLYENDDCNASSIVTPFFNTIGALCLNSDPPKLPEKSEDSFQILGHWTPDTIVTHNVGRYKYLFTPNADQNADTTSLWIEILAPIKPEFDSIGPFLVGSGDIILPPVSANGVEGNWHPAVVETSMVMTLDYTFVPIDHQCAIPFETNIEVNNIIDTTDMHRSTKWYTESFKNDGSNLELNSYVLNTIEVVKDTVIGNRFCYVIGITSDRVYYPESELIVYTKNGKFFFFEDNEWRLLYDFKALENDTVTFYISKKYPYYSSGTVPMFENNESLLTLNPHKYIVKQSGTLMDEKGNQLRIYGASWDFNEAFHSFGLIVEKAGSLYHLFGNYLIWTGEVRPPNVRCYKDDDIELNFVNEPCDKITSTKNLSHNIFSVHPNPTSNIIHFEGVTGDAIIDIYNLQGQLIGSQNIVDNQIDLGYFNSGMYILDIKTKHRSEKHKIIKID